MLIAATEAVNLHLARTCLSSWAARLQQVLNKDQLSHLHWAELTAREEDFLHHYKAVNQLLS